MTIDNIPKISAVIAFDLLDLFIRGIIPNIVNINPIINDEQLADLTDLTHGYVRDLECLTIDKTPTLRLGKVYIENVDEEEKVATNMEKVYLKNSSL